MKLEAWKLHSVFGSSGKTHTHSCTKSSSPHMVLPGCFLEKRTRLSYALVEKTQSAEASHEAVARCQRDRSWRLRSTHL